MSGLEAQTTVGLRSSPVVGASSPDRWRFNKYRSHEPDIFSGTSPSPRGHNQPDTRQPLRLARDVRARSPDHHSSLVVGASSPDRRASAAESLQIAYHGHSQKSSGSFTVRSRDVVSSVLLSILVVSCVSPARANEARHALAEASPTHPAQQTPHSRLKALNLLYPQIAKLLDSNGSSSDRFGFSVALDGDTAVVGAYQDDYGSYNDDPGTAFVFDRDQGGTDSWGLMATLRASDPGNDAQFGWSVAIDGDTIVIGAPGDDENDAFAGAAYVFYRDEGGADQWGQKVKITPGDAAEGDLFGYSVAIDGDTIVVGARYNDDACPTDPDCNSGSAYIFYRDEGGSDAWGEITSSPPATRLTETSSASPSPSPATRPSSAPSTMTQPAPRSPAATLAPSTPSNRTPEAPTAGARSASRHSAPAAICLATASP